MSRRRGYPNPNVPTQRRSGPPKPPRVTGMPNLNRYNSYRCPVCGISWLTVDLDPGVTPMFSPCYGTEGCRGTAYSAGYPEGPPPNLPLLIEWYKPANTNELSLEMKRNIEKGGLMRRAAMTAPNWVKRIA